MKTDIPYSDFGGEGQTMHFAHANGFPPETYNSIIADLTKDYHVIAMHARPLWPDSKYQTFNSWIEAADDLIEFLDSGGLSGIIGIGHSFGAICTVMAANKRPELFSKLILIEPVVLPRWFYLMNKIMPISIVKRINPVVKKTLVRREIWPDSESAFKQFRRNALFAQTPDKELWDYVNSALQINPNGHSSLRYSKDWEARVFLTVTNPWKALKILKHPFLVLRGEKSDTIFQSVWKNLKSIAPMGSFVEIQNSGHLVPIEQPRRVLEEIREFLGNS